WSIRPFPSVLDWVNVPGLHKYGSPVSERRENSGLDRKRAGSAGRTASDGKTNGKSVPDGCTQLRRPTAAYEAGKFGGTSSNALGTAGPAFDRGKGGRKLT